MDVTHVDAALAVCDREGIVHVASPGARALLFRAGVAFDRRPLRLPDELCDLLESRDTGSQIQWCPPDSDSVCIGCSAYGIGDTRWLLIMRELSDKQIVIASQLHQQRLEMIGRLATSVAHDLRSPLGSVLYNVECMLGAELSGCPPSFRSSLEDIARAASRIEAIVQRLLDFGRRQPPGEGSVAPLANVVDRVLGLVRPRMREGEHDVDVDVPDTLDVSGNLLLLEQSLTNLVLNAIESRDSGVRVRISGRRIDDIIEIEVSDDGPGIDAAVRGQLFEPFATTKPHGTGLGLASARMAARDLGGDIVLAQSDEQGACFQMTLPAPGSAPRRSEVS